MNIKKAFLISMFLSTPLLNAIPFYKKLKKIPGVRIKSAVYIANKKIIHSKNGVVVYPVVQTVYKPIITTVTVSEPLHGASMRTSS